MIPYKLAAFETTLQSVQQIKQKISDSIMTVSLSIQQMQAGIKQMQDVIKDVQQLDVQVRSLQQAQKAQIDQMNKSVQKASDGVVQNNNQNKQQVDQNKQQVDQNKQNTVRQVNISNKTWAPRKPTWWQKAWKAITPEQKYVDNPGAAEVAGVRGSTNNNDLFVVTAIKKHRVWMKNFDYKLSPYSNMDKIEKITDEVLDVCEKDK